MNIAVIGTGYVGLISALCFTKAGHQVICVDKDQNKIKNLQNGRPVIYEKGLQKLLTDSLANGNIKFTNDLQYAIKNSMVNILAVGTPQDEKTGEADLSYIFDAATESAKHIDDYKLFIIKSTVPVGTNHKVKEIIETESGIKIDIASNPEFMREGYAIDDFQNPDRIVIGCENDKSKNLIKDIYKYWLDKKFPIVFTDVKTAELIKYSCNAFLMTKIAFVNEISNLSEKANCNIADLTKAMGLDKRIGKEFLKPGPGVGGSCFPKDAKALLHIANQYQENLTILNQVIKANQQRFVDMANKIKSIIDKNNNDNNNKKEISILGLAFKAGTDDVRVSPAIEIIKNLLTKNDLKIYAYDPEAIANSRKILTNKIVYCESVRDCFNRAKYIVILTEWPEFKIIKTYSDFKNKVIIDLRNIL